MDIKPRVVSNVWSEVPGGLTWYFIGQPKTGKTTAASSWSAKGSDGVLVIDTDLGADFVEGAHVLTCTDLNIPKKDGEIIPPLERGYYHRTGPDKGKPLEVYSLAELYVHLKKNWEKLGYETLVIDTIDCVNKWIESTVCDELGINSMGEGQWGIDWGTARRKNLDVVKKLQNIIKKYGGNLIIISHSKTSTMTDGKIQLSPELPRGLGYSLCAKADVIGYSTVDRENLEYSISFQSYDERTIGSRLKPLAQKVLPFNYNDVTLEIMKYKTEE